MSRKTIAIALALFALPAFAADYVQAPGSTLVFAGKYQGEVFTGKFPGFATKFSFDPKQLAASKLDVTIPLATASTSNADYDGELRGSAFFDSAKFPQARYTATKFRALGGNRYAADGTLSLHGVDKPVTLEFTWTPGAKPVLAGKATVKRLEFGVGGGDWADTTLIPNAIAISIKVVFAPCRSGSCPRRFPAQGASDRGNPTLRRQESAQLFRIERPIQFDVARIVAQHRHAQAVAFLERIVAIDEDAFEFGRARLRQFAQREVAQVAVVALVEDQGHTPASVAGLQSP